MSIYQYNVSKISRGLGESAVESAAYRSGQKLHDIFYGLDYDYTRKKGIVYSEVLVPAYAPHEFADRQYLWNAVEFSERRRDSRLAREVEIALQIEFPLEVNISILHEYIQQNFIELGMCADLNIHDKGDGNPHAHILLTTRPVTREGFCNKKNRNWDKRSNVEIWRKEWADICNKKFRQLGIDERIDHRTLCEQGIDREATKHLGRRVKRLEKHGILTDRLIENREIEARNKERDREYEYER